MSNKSIIYTLIAFVAVSASLYLYWNSARSSNPSFAGSQQLGRPRKDSKEQKATSLPPLPAVEARKEQIVPFKDKKIEIAKEYVTAAEGLRTEDSQVIKRSTAFTYGKAMKALGLSTEEQAKLMDLLIKRAEVLQDLRDVVPQHSGTTQAESKIAIAQAYAEVDTAIEATFGAEKYARIKEMIISAPFLVRINAGFDPSLTSAGQSLSPEQLLTAAMVMSESYGSLGSPDTMPTQSNVDGSSGLTPVDQAVLSRLTPVMNPEQLRIFQQVMSARNSQYLKLQRSQQKTKTNS